MKTVPGFTDAQACGKLHGMPNAEPGTILGPGTDGAMYQILAVEEDGTVHLGPASAHDIDAALARTVAGCGPQSVTESQWTKVR